MGMDEHDVVERENEMENVGNADDKVHAKENEENVDANMNELENVGNADDKVLEMENEENVDDNMNESENVEDIVNNMENVENAVVIVNNMENLEDVVNNMENIENIEGEVAEPSVGMEFESLEELHDYYKTYGKQLGFSASRKGNKKGDDGELNYVTMGCSRSGKPKSKSINKVRSHPVSKTDCKAKIRATLCHDRMWRITKIVTEHNHELNPGKTKIYRSNVKRKIELNDSAGIRVNKNCNSSGHENMSFLEKDCKNYDHKKRLLQLGVGDAPALQDYFLKMQVDNANFFYVIDLDEESRLRNVFWADARSRAAYEEFGDVVTFDTTYLTNKYNIPLALFVGINHHGQSILLGCGLISSEDTKTFTWLLQSWLACMSGRVPIAIITDQDKAMQNAIEIVFPSSRHRWCLWHIMKKLLEKLRSHKQYESIKFTLQNIVYDSLSHDVFEESWNQMVEKYDLRNNNWLIELYNERRRWVPTFVKDIFWAGMSTTQRSESMHAFFDGYVNSKTTIKQFMEQYNNTLRSKVEKETHEDFNSFTSKVPCVTRYPMEKQLQDIYTTAKFQEFQHELTKKIYCEVSSFREDDGELWFEVCEDIIVGEIQKSVIFKVGLHEGVNCNCCMFEYRGILCRHVLAVLIHRKICVIPDKYIIRRWRKDVKRRHTRVKINYDDWNVKPEAQRFDSMCNAFCKVANLSAESEDKYNMVMDWITALKEEVQRNVGVCGSNQPTPKSTMQNVNQPLLWDDTQRALNHPYGWLGEP